MRSKGKSKANTKIGDLFAAESPMDGGVVKPKATAKSEDSGIANERNLAAARRP